MRRCSPPGEVEVLGVQREVRGCLEAAQEACGPSLAVVEGAAGKVVAAVCEVVRRMTGPSGDIGGGCGARVGCGLEVCATGAGLEVAPDAGRHGSPCGQRRRYAVP